jgi:hypothetical protein
MDFHFQDDRCPDYPWSDYARLYKSEECCLDRGWIDSNYSIFNAHDNQEIIMPDRYQKRPS